MAITVSKDYFNMKKLVFLILSCMFYSSNITQTQILVQNSFLQENGLNSEVFIVVLGTIQDAGSPQINCKKECCKD